jgi:excisionase family DNA binding protein
MARLDDLPIMVTVPELSERLGVTGESLRRWLRVGLVRGVKFGRTWRIPRDECLRIAREGVPESLTLQPVAEPVELAGGRVHPAGSSEPAEESGDGYGWPRAARIIGG